MRCPSQPVAAGPRSPARRQKPGEQVTSAAATATWTRQQANRMLIDDHRPSTRPSTPQGNVFRRWSSQTSSFLAPLVLRNRRLCSAMRARPPQWNRRRRPSSRPTRPSGRSGCPPTCCICRFASQSLSAASRHYSSLASLQMIQARGSESWGNDHRSSIVGHRSHIDHRPSPPLPKRQHQRPRPSIGSTGFASRTIIGQTIHGLREATPIGHREENDHRFAWHPFCGHTLLTCRHVAGNHVRASTTLWDHSVDRRKSALHMCVNTRKKTIASRTKRNDRAV